ncbi:MAG: HAD-IC family P-type ATPase, partial [Bacteroidota bacterium]
HLLKLRVEHPELFSFVGKVIQERRLHKERIPAEDFLKYFTPEAVKTFLQSVDLEKEETGMTYLGQAVLRNPLKEKTKSTISRLRFNLYECKMVTGDNLFTAINVSRFAGILDLDTPVWAAQWDPVFQRVNWMHFHFDGTPESNLMQTVKGSGFAPKTELSQFDGISRITPLREANQIASKIHTNVVSNRSIRKVIAASHITQSHMINESELQSLQQSRYSQIADSIVVARQSITLPELMERAETRQVFLAIDGATLDWLLQNHPTEKERNFIWNHTRVFARTNPDQKQTIVQGIRALRAKSQKGVAFVGDGSNDCKALNKANVGLAIGNNEASVSSSLVTSDEEISKIEDVLELGKFSLSTMFEIFLINNCLSFMEMTCYFFLVANDFYFMNWKYVLETLVFTPFAFFMVYGPSNRELNKFFPKAGIFNKSLALFMIAQAVLSLALVTCGYVIYSSSFFHKQYEEIFGEEVFTDLEFHFTVEPMLLTLLFSFISTGFVFGLYIGFPFRKSVFSNPLFVLYLVFLVALNLITLFPDYITSSYSFNWYVNYFTRSPDLDPEFAVKWVVFGVFAGLLTFLLAKILRYHTINEQVEEVKTRILREKERNLRHDAGRPISMSGLVV